MENRKQFLSVDEVRKKLKSGFGVVVVHLKSGVEIYGAPKKLDGQFEDLLNLKAGARVLKLHNNNGQVSRISIVERKL